MRIAPLLVLALPLSGCVASMAAGVATTAVKAPFKVSGKAIDMATTSQDEADRNLGRKVRKRREQEQREQRKRDKERAREHR